jgi:hypothetical protein
VHVSVVNKAAVAKPNRFDTALRTKDSPSAFSMASVKRTDDKSVTQIVNTTESRKHTTDQQVSFQINQVEIFCSEYERL